MNDQWIFWDCCLTLTAKGIFLDKYFQINLPRLHEIYSLLFSASMNRKSHRNFSECNIFLTKRCLYLKLRSKNFCAKVYLARLIENVRKWKHSALYMQFYLMHYASMHRNVLANNLSIERKKILFYWRTSCLHAKDWKWRWYIV